MLEAVLVWCLRAFPITVSGECPDTIFCPTDRFFQIFAPKPENRSDSCPDTLQTDLRRRPAPRLEWCLKEWVQRMVRGGVGTTWGREVGRGLVHASSGWKGFTRLWAESLLSSNWRTISEVK